MSLASLVTERQLRISLLVSSGSTKNQTSFSKPQWNDGSYHGKGISRGGRIMAKCSVTGRVKSSPTDSQEGSNSRWLSRQFHQTVEGHAKLYKSV